MGIFETSGEDDDFFVDIAVLNNVGEAVANRIVDDNVEAGFFFDFAKGGFDFGFAGFDMAFGETPMVVGLVF